MKVHDCLQGSEQWLRLRSSCPTASELDRIIEWDARAKPTPRWKIRDSKGVKTYVARKLSELWLAAIDPSLIPEPYEGGSVEQGKILESEALPAICAHLQVDLTRLGFVTTDDGSFGCSPDAYHPALLQGFEIKCPDVPANHVAYLLANECPDKFFLQCQGGLYVTGAERWTLVSYRRSFPMLVVDVLPDPEVQAVIGSATAACMAQIHAGWDYLCKLNGGPPRRRLPPIPVEGITDMDPFASEPLAPDEASFLRDNLNRSVEAL